MDWYLEALKKYAVVAGRASRREYWSFVLLSVLISLVLTAIDLIIGRYDEARGVGPLSSLFTLAMLLPLVCVSVRRLHDTGRSGWWLLVGLVPVLGGLALLVLTLSRGQREPNGYGPVPALPQ